MQFQQQPAAWLTRGLQEELVAGWEEIKNILQLLRHKLNFLLHTSSMTITIAKSRLLAGICSYTNFGATPAIKVKKFPWANWLSSSLFFLLVIII